MIESFRHKGLKRLFEKDDRKALPSDMVQRIRIILADLEEAITIEEMDRPSFKLHPLKGGRKGILVSHSARQLADRLPFRKRRSVRYRFVDYH